MKFKFSYAATVALLAALAIPVSLAAQELLQRRQLPHYTITDLGTLAARSAERMALTIEAW
ncbi:MAG TPA: hypothetical protein VGR48_01115 [Terriglobales bacterium]|nr:hypothetical protein [Terriglobales bacterium]